MRRHSPTSTFNQSNEYKVVAMEPVSEGSSYPGSSTIMCELFLGLMLQLEYACPCWAPSRPHGDCLAH